MPRAAVVLAFVMLLAGCAQPEPSRVVVAGQSEPVRAQPCDDGGDGGVLINGVCL